MKVLVAFKRVIDPDARIKLNASKSAVDESSVEYKANPFCENALEEAIRLKEEHDAEVVLVNLGTDDSTAQIRAGLAMGADRAIRVDIGDNALDSDLAARLLAAVWQREKPEVFLFGKQAIDGEVDGGLETIALGLPCVISADLRLNTPRYAKLPDIMKAKKKPIDELELDELGVTDTAVKIAVVSLEEPPKRSAGVKVGSVDELVGKLRTEARVI